MKRITQTKEIQTGDNSGIVVSGDEKISYSSEFELVDYDLDDLITKRAAQDLVNESDPSSVLKPWVPDNPTKTDEYRSYVIDDIEYLFRSNVDDNVSTPSISSEESPAWTNEGETSDGFSPDLWVDSTTYNTGDFARIVAGSKNIFKSKVDGNLNNEPVFDTSDAFWECIGTYRGLFPSGAPYAVDDVVFDTTTTSVYVSNFASNNYDLDELVPASTWQVISLYKKITTVDESALIEESYGDMWYLPVDLAGKKLLSVEITQGDITTYRGPESLSNDVAWSLPRISGFPNNDPQTIKITTL